MEFTALLHAFTVIHHLVSDSLALLHYPSPPCPLQLYFRLLSVIRTIEPAGITLPTWPAWRGLPTSLSSPSLGHAIGTGPSVGPLALWMRSQVIQMLRAYLTNLQPGDTILTPGLACAGQSWPYLGPNFDKYLLHHLSKKKMSLSPGQTKCVNNTICRSWHEEACLGPIFYRALSITTHTQKFHLFKKNKMVFLLLRSQ